MDIRMPEMDGHTALTELRKIPGTELLPVIAVTASSMMDDEQALRSYFAGYVRKPFTRQALFHELAAFLPRRSRDDKTAPANAPRAASSAASPESWAGFVPSLRQLETSLWREASESGSLNHIRAFADRLIEMACAADCPPVQDYAAALRRDADEYAISRMEQRLKEYPELVRSLDAQSKSAATVPTTSPAAAAQS